MTAALMRCCGRCRSRTGSRRRALSALLVALGVPGVAALEAEAERRKGKGKGKGKHRTEKHGKKHRRKGKGKKAGAQAKVTLCHKPGTPDEKTISVGAPAVAAHLARRYRRSLPGTDDHDHDRGAHHHDDESTGDLHGRGSIGA